MDPPVPGEGAVHMALPAPIRLQITFYTSMCSASEKAHMREHISGFACSRFSIGGARVG